MQAIFHIGLPKTGTTTLQNSLHAARGALARNDILYPSLERLGHLNHHPLILSVLPQEKLPRPFRFKRESSLRRLAARASAQVAAEIAAAKPGHLLLSSEYFSRDFTPEEFSRLKAMLMQFGISELAFCVYIRRPSAHYLSLLTQSLRHSGSLRPPVPFGVRRRIETLAAAFPEARVVPAVFAREALAGGDIVTDFAARFLAPLGVTVSDIPRLEEANVSVSGESTDILMAFRRHAFPGGDNRPERASTALFGALAMIEARIGPRRPKLRPDVAAFVDGSNDDVAWLKAQYGLVFPGEGALAAPAGFVPAYGMLSDLIEIDADYRAKLLGELEASAWAWRPWRREWVRALAAGEAPSPRRAVWRRLFGA